MSRSAPPEVGGRYSGGGPGHPAVDPGEPSRLLAAGRLPETSRWWGISWLTDSLLPVFLVTPIVILIPAFLYH